MIPPRDPNASHDRESHDRESLSALFDGELQGDAARFACKRLVQDEQWRQSCGNWQLAGDVLRGRSMAPAPPDFARKVQAELAREVRMAADASTAAVPVRRSWMGGAALAASVAVAAWFVANPFDDGGPATPAPTTTIAAASPPAAADVVTPSAAAADPEGVLQNPQAPGDRTRRTAGRTSRPTTNPRVASAVPMPTQQASALESVDSSDMLSGSSDTNAALADPFRLPAPQDTAPRPWPRAVLPGYRSSSTELTTGYGTGLHNADAGVIDGPTFYPFEPRLAPDQDAPTTSDQSGP